MSAYVTVNNNMASVFTYRKASPAHVKGQKVPVLAIDQGFLQRLRISGSFLHFYSVGSHGRQLSVSPMDRLGHVAQHGTQV